MFRSRFWLTVILAVPVVLYSRMFQRLLDYTAPQFPGSDWVSPLLGTAIFLYGGWPFLTGALSEIRSRQPGMMLLIGLAITVAFIASWATELGAVDLDFWWELAALIAVMLLGHWLEMRAVGQASGALEALAGLLPDQAERITSSGVETVGLEALRPGDIVLVRSGARVPADGEIVEGSAEIDESMITGESRPVGKDPGDKVVAGTVSTDSAIRVRVTAGSVAWSNRPSGRIPGPRRSRIEPPPFSSTWRARPDSSPTSCGLCWGSSEERSSEP
jgi:Cu2+-exporting ATPase